jgi:hypothetical protein
MDLCDSVTVAVANFPIEDLSWGCFSTVFEGLEDFPLEIFARSTCQGAIILYIANTARKNILEEKNYHHNFSKQSKLYVHAD